MKFLMPLCFVFLMFLSPLSGATSVVTEINFVRINNLGIKKSDHLKIYPDRVQLGQMTLKSAEAKKIAAWIQDYKSLPNQASCRAGTFEITKSKLGRQDLQKGCAEGVAYAELLLQFQRLENLWKKESAHGS